MLTPADRSALHRGMNLVVRGGLVKRYHALPVVVNETVGHHSFLVAWLCASLSHPTLPRTELLLAALQHDLPEHKTGDIPAPAKRRYALAEQFEQYEKEILEESAHHHWLSELTPGEQRVLKLADCLAGLVHCVHERRLGNQYLLSTFGNYVAYVTQLLQDFPDCDVGSELLSHLQEQWNECQ